MYRTNRWNRVAVVVLALLIFPSLGRGEHESVQSDLSVSVSLLDGRSFDARLLSMTASDVVVEVAGKSEAISKGAISSLRFLMRTRDRLLGESRVLEDLLGQRFDCSN